MSAHKSSRIRSACSVFLLAFTALAIAEFIAPSYAWAHKVNVFAYVEGETVVTESYFNDGRKCRDSTIEVFDEKGNKLVEGQTDAEGGFSFQAPMKANLLIRLTASMGHQAEYTIQANELPDNLPGATGGPKETMSNTPDKTSPEPTPEKLRSIKTSAGIDVEEAVEKAVARQLAPVQRKLDELKSKQRFSDIVGGIGYIVGLMGLALYFHARRRQRGREE